MPKILNYVHYLQYFPITSDSKFDFDPSFVGNRWGDMQTNFCGHEIFSNCWFQRIQK